MYAAALPFLTGGRHDDNRAARVISDLGGCSAKTQSRKPSWPREPTTSRSASHKALMSSLAVTRNHSLWDAVAVVLGTVLSTDEDIRAAEREQWDDHTNYLAVAPGGGDGFMNATCLPTRCCAGMAIEVISWPGTSDPLTRSCKAALVASSA